LKKARNQFAFPSFGQEILKQISLIEYSKHFKTVKIELLAIIGIS
jgi:hypothetical protein